MQGIELSGMGKRTDQLTTAAASTFFGFNKKNFAHTLLISPAQANQFHTPLLKFEKPICNFSKVQYNGIKYIWILSALIDSKKRTTQLAGPETRKVPGFMRAPWVSIVLFSIVTLVSQ